MPLTADQLALRKTMLTATDAVVLAGVYPGKRNACSIYLDKVGEPEAFDGSQVAVTVGHVLEPLAIQLVADERRLIVAPGDTVRHATEAWIGATPDAFVMQAPAKALGGKGREPVRVGVVEAKAVGYERMRHWGEDLDAVPEYVHVQVQWQLLATGLKTAYVSALFGTRHASYVIEHDDALASALLEVCGAFWKNHIAPRRMPSVDGSESAWKMVKAAWPKPVRGGLLWAAPEIATLAEEALAAAKQRAHWEKLEAQKKQQLCALIGDNEGYEGNGWRAKWSMRAGYTRPACEIAPTRALDLREVKASKGKAA